MAQLVEKNELDYRQGGDTIDDFAQKHIAEMKRIFQFLNDLREHKTTGIEVVEPAAGMLKVEDDKIYIRNSNNDEWVLLGEAKKNFGFTAKTIGAVASSKDGLGKITIGNDADKPLTDNANNDVYFAVDTSSVYIFLSDAWKLFVTLDAKKLAGIDEYVTKSMTVASGGNEGNIPVIGANGILNFDTTGNAGKLAGIAVTADKIKDGQVLTYRAASGGWRNEDKGTVGAGKSLVIRDGEDTLVDFSGDETKELDLERSKHYADEDAHAAAFAKYDKSSKTTIKDIMAAAPNYYCENEHFATVISDNRTSIKSPKRLLLEINGTGYEFSSITLDAATPSSWDTDAREWQASHDYEINDVVYPLTGHTNYYYRCITAGKSSSLTPEFPTSVGETYNDGNVVWECQLDYTIASNRAGKDFYIYAVTKNDSYHLALCANSTVPLGYTAENSRKIGGFHCLCKDVGTISGHTLSGYKQGDILPASVWDLSHRPKSEPEGMVYVDGLDLWVDIYLASYTGSTKDYTIKLVSKYGAITADGTSAEKFHCYKFEQVFGEQKKRLLYQREFIVASVGSNQATNVKGSADVTTTGGFVDTAGRRMISNYGIEDMCGNLWQWGADTGSAYTGNASYGNAFDANDRPDIKGQWYGGVFRPLLGGAADYGAVCGSRASNWTNGALYLYWSCGGRGASEPLG